MFAGFSKIARYWWPPRVDIPVTAAKLSRFYAERADYHAMTANEDKIDHPQVRMLLEMAKPSDRVVEFGCGGGLILNAVSQRVRQAIGFDISNEALARARRRPGRQIALQGDVANIPLPDGCADIAYSLEVLEHIWDAEAVIREMIRVTKPGGTVFFTTPNGYSLDLHLPLRPLVRWLNFAGALTVHNAGRFGRIYQNIPPDLEAMPVYPDCDMITRIHPRELEGFARQNGCQVQRLETFFFQVSKARSEAEKGRYLDLERHPFYHYYGDHIMFLGRKK
jgi:SAM-dependent methyltransferase